MTIATFEKTFAQQGENCQTIWEAKDLTARDHCMIVASNVQSSCSFNAAPFIQSLDGWLMKSRCTKRCCKYLIVRVIASIGC